jgi:hypothetical protein
MKQRSPKSRLEVLLKRIDHWEGLDEGERGYPSVTEELLLDIRDCLKSLVEADTL